MFEIDLICKPLGKNISITDISIEKMFYLATHSTHFTYGYMASVWLKWCQIYGKGPSIHVRQLAAATTWATLSD